MAKTKAAYNDKVHLRQACAHMQLAQNMGMQVLLEYQGQKLGLLEVESRWTPDKAYETLKAYGTSALEHPGLSGAATLLYIYPGMLP
jgi:ATP sulfurylase